jgi:hypothetical protein
VNQVDLPVHKVEKLGDLYILKRGVGGVGISRLFASLNWLLVFPFAVGGVGSLTSFDELRGAVD